jgi:hypothetical protein
MVERSLRPVFSEDALAALDSSWEGRRRYGAALAALADDRPTHARIVEQLSNELSPSPDLSRVDDIIIYQAVSSRGDLDELATMFQTFSADHFRLSHLVAIATAAQDRGLADRVTKAMRTFAQRRPETAELNRFRQTLTNSYLKLGRTREVRAAPTTLSFLYGAIRTVVAQLDRAALLDMVSELEKQSVFWPADLTAGLLDSGVRTTMTASELTALIETADRCGLIVDLIDAASARATSRLSLQLATGIRRIEGLLFPFAAPRSELASRGRCRVRTA